MESSDAAALLGRAREALDAAYVPYSEYPVEIGRAHV